MKEEKLLVSGAKTLGINLDDKQVNQFIKYLNLIGKWNKELDLLGVSKREDIIAHLLDSISCVASEKIGDRSKVVDIGAGAGLPGIPVKIASPKIEVTLVDSSYKKVWFVKQVISRLGLKDCEAIQLRSEEFGRKKEGRGKFDIILSRALSPLSVLTELALPLLKVGGYLIAQKGKKAEEEVKGSGKAIEVLGGTLDEIKEVNVPYLPSKRYLVLVKKVRATPSKYPRRVGIPKKRPLFNKERGEIVSGRITYAS